MQFDRLRLVAALVIAAALWLPAAAQATCTPDAGNNVNATCTGTTINQSGGNGYGTGAETNLTVTVVPNASVTGTDSGLFFSTGSVSNAGTISGGFEGVDVDVDGTVTNSGFITGAVNGIYANNAVTVINSGTISGDINGINANFATITNSGTISGGSGDGIGVIDATVTNSGSITGGENGIFGDHIVVTNSGVITGGSGIEADTNVIVFNSGTIATTDPLDLAIFSHGVATVINSGTIIGGDAGVGGHFVNVTNTGTIMAGGAGVDASHFLNLTNAGTITGDHFGVHVFGTENVINSGTISGGEFAIVGEDGTVTNSGVIAGGTAAFFFFAGGPDTLTLLPGSTIIGAINLGGGGDTINFRGGNHNLTFDTLAGATVTSSTPFVVSGNRAVAIDVTPFAMAGRNLLDLSRAVSSAVPETEGSFTATTAAADSGSALAFAGPDGNASTITDDVAAIPGLSAYAEDSTLPFKSPTVVYGNGTALWARGFVGERVQDADGALLETHNRFYGGLLGGGWQVRPNLRLGLFLGAGETRSQVDPGYGETKSTLVFAGLTGRYTWDASFLRFGLQGGHSSNDSTRNTNNNLVAGGIENATASFDGWYVTPEATFGHRFALGSVGGGAYTLTPSLTVRYLHASFDGYTETGTTAPLTVGDRTADSFEERGQLKLTRTQVFAPTEVLKTSLFGGVLADQRVGDDSVDATLLGQAIPFAVPGDDSVWGGFGGLGLEWHTGRVTLFASAEYLALSDSSSVVSGQGGLRVAF